MSTEDTIRKALSDVGIVGNFGEFHSWRCAYPERYGSCDCVEVFIADLTEALMMEGYPFSSPQLRASLGRAAEMLREIGEDL